MRALAEAPLPENEREPRHWLWVTGPEYYLDENGAERRDLEPSAGFSPTAWWTCSPETRAGDTALIYRSRTKKDIAHYAVVRSDPELLDLPGDRLHGRPACQFEIIERFSRPIRWDAINNDEALREWNAVKVKFVRSSFAVPDAHWDRLVRLAGREPDHLAKQALDGLYRIRKEREIQEKIAHDPERLARAGLKGLRLVKKEYRFSNGRRADLLYTRGWGPFTRDVIVELKRGVIDERAVTQVLDYADLIKHEHGRSRRRALTVLIGDDLHADARKLIGRGSRRPTFIRLAELGFARE